MIISFNVKLSFRSITANNNDDPCPFNSEVLKLTNLTSDVVKTFPLQHITSASKLLAPGIQCQICLRSFVQGQSVRCLPCKHKFHHYCIDDWLLHRSPTCPIDGTTYSNETIKQMQQAQLLIRLEVIFIAYLLLRLKSHYIQKLAYDVDEKYASVCMCIHMCI